MFWPSCAGCKADVVESPEVGRTMKLQAKGKSDLVLSEEFVLPEFQAPQAPKMIGRSCRPKALMIPSEAFAEIPTADDSPSSKGTARSKSPMSLCSTTCSSTRSDSSVDMRLPTQALVLRTCAEPVTYFSENPKRKRRSRPSELKI